MHIAIDPYSRYRDTPMLRHLKLLISTALLAATALVHSGVQARPPADKPSHAETLCSIVLEQARKQNLPEGFFARLIWKESLFDVNAVSPKGAQGIAQFMPGTARDRGLADPFLAAEALAASAHLLADLRDSFGNLGLAAAAYNAGAERVEAWLGGATGLPLETLDYVLYVTGRPADDWKSAEARFALLGIGKGEDFTSDCIRLASRQKHPPAVAGGFTTAPLTPWGSQLAGALTEQAAIAAFRRLQKAHGGVLAGLAPTIIRRRMPDMGTRVHVRIGAQTRAEAERFCSKLRADGGACVVMRN
ncbi:MAG: transglycosylase SLT domain-containing protein [Hyphomicrobiales bacterium]